MRILRHSIVVIIVRRHNIYNNTHTCMQKSFICMIRMKKYTQTYSNKANFEYFEVLNALTAMRSPIECTHQMVNDTM